MQKPNILVVDDEQLNVELISMLLDKDCVVKAAFDASRALMILEKITIDLLLLDVNMPDIDGFQLAEKIKSNPLTADIPIIFLTASDDEKSIIKGFQYGAVDYITKPFNKEELRVRVNNHLRTHLLQQELYRKINELKDAHRVILEEQNKFSVLGKMVSTIAHQWKQPLTELSMIQIYLRALNQEPKFESKLDESEKIIEFMALTIDAFQNFYKKENDTEEFVIQESIEETLLILQSSIEFDAISVEKHLEGDLKIKGFKNSLSHVILAIVQNMIENFKMQKSENPCIGIELKKEEEDILIVLYDNGGGIKIEPIHSIFELYVNENKTSSTGMGLYMAKKIITEKYGGTIEAANDQEGARFTIRI
jgi:DNA-binding response OmpR family regulator